MDEINDQYSEYIKNKKNGKINQLCLKSILDKLIKDENTMVDPLYCKLHDI
jgi:hypothetical protein